MEKYFDYAATCPLDQDAAQLYLQTATEFFANTSSLHDAGSTAAQLLETCRSAFAELLGVTPAGIYFTSGGTEGNFLAIQALLSAAKDKKHIITSIAEHASVHSTLKKLEENGYEVTALPYNQAGHVEAEQVQAAMRTDTALVTIQHANAEIGTLQPIEEISKLCREHGVLMHADCVQSFGKLDLQGVAQAVDSLTISGHKFYGPKGVGAVYVNPRLHWHSFYPGTSHEKGFRPGTVNVPAIAAMTLAAQKAVAEAGNQHEHFLNLRRAFLQGIQDKLAQIIVYPADLPAIIGLRIKGLEGQLVMLECNRHGFAISTGSACQVGSQEPARTMVALGVAVKEAKEFIRISFGRDTSVDATEELAKTLIRMIGEQEKSNRVAN